MLSGDKGENRAGEHAGKANVGDANAVVDAANAVVGVLTGSGVVPSAVSVVLSAVGVVVSGVGVAGSAPGGVLGGGEGALFERFGAGAVISRETVPLPRALLWGGLELTQY